MRFDHELTIKNYNTSDGPWTYRFVQWNPRNRNDPTRLDQIDNHTAA